jgi:hypothetical protein
MSEYIAKQFSIIDLEAELQELIRRYESVQGTQLFVYSGALSKPIPDISINMDDYFIIFDMLRKSSSKKLDFYIETPGGSGEAAEEVANFLHDKFEEVRFVISGEAKSAGTILALSGHDILMTASGSLGPIDAQVRIGRSTISAYDYMEWINDQRKNAAATNSLNPVDATVIAQISPGEIKLIDNLKHYALDLVEKWLPLYKYKAWTKTETRQIPVTTEMKEKAAKDVAQKLVDHGNWRSHGRSIKSNDLADMGLKIKEIDSDKKVSEIVYRIQTVIRLIFSSTSNYKIFITSSDKIFKSAVPVQSQSALPEVDGAKVQPDVVKFQIKCSKCGKQHNLYAKTKTSLQIDEDMKKQGLIPIPPIRKLKCVCGFEIDLLGIINECEKKISMKLVF